MSTKKTKFSGDKVTAELLVPSVGALIFASDDPVRPAEIAEVLGNLDVKQVEEAIGTLQEQFEQSAAGLRLESIAGGFRLATRPEVGAWVRRFFQQRNRTRLSPAALETLAIIAYRQPVTGPEIQSIRGKDPSAALKGLLDKTMIRILGKKKVVGNPLLYGTSKHFLVHFGLNRLDDLPSIDEFDEFVGALENEQARLFSPARGGDEELEVDIEALSEDTPAEPAGQTVRPEEVEEPKEVEELEELEGPQDPAP
jgi:segregation and condensation protein B